MIVEEIMEAEVKERERIVKFLWDVFEASTHGASNLFERAIKAIEGNAMDDPVDIARPRVNGEE